MGSTMEGASAANAAPQQASAQPRTKGNKRVLVEIASASLLMDTPV